MAASRHGNTDIVRYLLKMGAKIDEKNDHIFHSAQYYLSTSLIIASENGHVNVVKYLLDKGAKVESKNDRHLKNYS